MMPETTLTGANTAPLPTFEQAELMKQLEQLGPHRIHEMPDMAARVSHSGELPQYDADRPPLPRGLHLNQDTLQPYRDSGELRPASVGFSLQPMAEVGRTSQGEKDSRNGTFFGKLNLTSASGEVEEVPVAVKPIPLSNPDRLTQEGSMLEYARSQGLPALEVVGVYMDLDSAVPTGYMMTRQQPGIQSLNTLDWTKEVANAPSHMDTATTTLAALHAELIFHRDLEFKNISSLDEEGSFVVYDLEWAISLKDVAEGGGEGAEERLSGAIERDLDDVRKSMGEFIYPNLPDGTAMTEQQRFDYELDHLYEPYHLKIMGSGSPHSALLDRAYRAVLERRLQAVAPQAGGVNG